MNTPDENQQIQTVIQKAMQPDENAQRELYSRFYGYAMSICIRYAHNREEAEEVLNDGFIKVFKNLDRYDSSLSFKAWLRRILINTAIDYHRKYQKYHHTLDIAHAKTTSVEASSLSDISAREILQLVQRLAPSYRTVFNLYVIEGFKHKEIAEQLDITEATSRATLAIARQKLQRMVLDSTNYKKRTVNG